MRALLNKIRDQLAQVPLLGWLIGALVAVAVEYLVGEPLALALGMTGIPSLFGLEIIFKQPLLIPSAIVYVLLVYISPAIIVARLISSLANRLAAKLLSFSLGISVVIHLGLLYAALHMLSLIHI